jgi:putative NADH-flavin reductase
MAYANKRKKMDDQETTEPNNDDYVFEIINVSSGEKWTEVVKKDKKKQEKKENKGTERKQLTARVAWRKPLVVGTAKSDEIEHKVDVADVSLVAAGLSKEATAEQLKAFVTQQGLTVTSCSLMTDPSKNPEYRSNTFKVTIKAEDMRRLWTRKCGLTG